MMQLYFQEIVGCRLDQMLDVRVSGRIKRIPKLCHAMLLAVVEIGKRQQYTPVLYVYVIQS